jgi:hypothetical protein
MQTKYARGSSLTQLPGLRAAECERELADCLRHQAVVDPRAALAGDLDEPDLAQHLQVVRDRRLGEAERADEVADAYLVGSGQAVDDRHPARVGQRLEARRQRLRHVLVERRGAGAAARLQNLQFLFIDVYQYTDSGRTKGGDMYACDCDCCGGGCC